MRLTKKKKKNALISNVHLIMHRYSNSKGYIALEKSAYQHDAGRLYLGVL